MAKDYHAEIYLHLTWHTQDDAPLITSPIEARVWNAIKAKCVALGAQPIEIGGTEDHVHLIASIPPNVLISELVGQVKGASSRYANQKLRTRGRFAWQKGYGCVSFAKRNLAALRRYVRNQKTHHGEGATREALERCAPEHNGSSRAGNPRKRG